MPALCFLVVCSYTFTIFSLYDPIAAYTLTPSEPLTDGHNLTSQGGTFQLGFFSPSTASKKRYLGIWYSNIPVQTVVWVANRVSPLYDTSGALKIGSSGNLVIVNQTDDLIWSTNASKAVGSPVVELLESGNLVLRDLRYNGSKSYLWQSFDDPSNTLLPGMKQGWNLKTGRNWYMTSWKSFDDPSPGDYTYGLELGGSPEFIIRKGLDTYYRAGSWNGLQASGSPELLPNPKFTYDFVDNAEDIYFMYHVLDHLSKVRLFLTQTGTEGFVQILSWVDKTNSWIVQLQIPRDRCDVYKLCGAYSICDVSSIEVCQCLKGFKPKSLVDWGQFDWSLGCEREVPVQCGKREGFQRYTEVKLPEAIKGTWVNKSMNLEECKAKCLSNCSCRAYTNSDIRQGGSGCILWFVDPVDMRTLRGVKQDLYIRMAASELEEKVRRKGHLILIVSIPSVVLVSAIALGIFCICKKRRKKGGCQKDDRQLLPYRDGDDSDLPLYDLVTITSATNNFSEEHKLGEGGFGPVYKGVLNGREVAVKRLSNNSIQGANEFKNEVTLISKIQHRNLVRILGYCVQQDEKLLIYEYMQNNSLDTFIFDGGEGRSLNWQKRSEIILGIARGLLYLHHDSVLRIIHRDLKASNVLLDSEMVAKISDFGLAKIFEGNQTEARTKRVVGTRGYMSPEYAVDGHFSAKSDVFSFGVLVLEIISGKRNRGFSHPDHELNLLGHAWRLWNEDKSMELADESMNSHCFIEEISRCIHIGLLCVQKGVAQRPSMSSVLLMLSSETTSLPRPQHPGFYIERSTITEGQSSHSEIEAHDSMCADITTLEPR